MTAPADPLAHWRAELAGWAIPEEITSAVAESPWVLPRQVFLRRADRRRAEPSGPSVDRAAEVLDPPGEVLDVGAGAGAGGLALAGQASLLAAVDVDRELLDAFAERAAATGVPVATTLGRWPDVAADVPPVDVVVCHHVLYNVPDLAPFVAALTAHARRRVVVEMTARHPLAALTPLWLRFHGLPRPDGPSADDAVAALRAIGVEPQRQDWTRPGEISYPSFDDLVEVTRRRLCLPPERSGEVAEALRDLGVEPGEPLDLGSAGRDIVTLWWPGSGPR